MIQAPIDWPSGILPILPPECDPPDDLGTREDAERLLREWTGNMSVLSDRMRRAVVSITIVSTHRGTIVSGQLPPNVIAEAFACTTALERMGPEIARAVIKSLARSMELDGQLMCVHHVVCESVRLLQLIATGHVRRHLRRKYPDKDHWRKVIVEVLVGSHSQAFYGEADPGVRLLRRIEEMDVTADAAVAGGRLGGVDGSPTGGGTPA